MRNYQQQKSIHVYAHFLKHGKTPRAVYCWFAIILAIK